METAIRTATPRWIRHLVATGALALAACSGSDDTDDPPVLPDETDTGDEDSDTGPFEFPIDTSEDPDLNEEPAHWLHAYQTGSWNLSPGGGTFDNLTGTMEVLEFIDFTLPEDTGLDTSGDTGVPWDTDNGENPLLCQVTYNLLGTASDQSCTGCTVTMDVTFYVLEGDPGACRDPELPRDQEVRRLGYDPGQGAMFMYRAAHPGERADVVLVP